MKQVTEELIQKMVDIIVNEADPEKVILFGSQARGDARAPLRTWISSWSSPNPSAKTEEGEPRPCASGARFRASGFRKTFSFTATTKLNTGAILSITSSRERFGRER